MRPAPHSGRLARALPIALLAGLATPALAAPPSIQCPPSQVTYESGGVYFIVAASDPDGDPVTLSVVNPPARATFDPPSGTFTWVPDFNQAGSYAVLFRATAAGQTAGQTAECTVPITVGNYNRPPRITCPPALSGTLGDTLRAQLAAVDYDGDALVFSGVGLPAGATISPSGAFAWATTPETALGPLTIQARVSDGGFTVGCSFVATVFGYTGPPRLTCPTVPSTLELDVIDFTLGILDPSGLPVTVTASALPPGSVFDGPTRRFTWTPSLTQSGAWAPVFTATNGQSQPSTCTVAIQVLDRIVQPPQVTCHPPQSVTELQTITFQLAATDPQGYPFTFGATSLPPGATLAPSTGVFTWTPTLTQSGIHDIVFTASNGAAVGSCTQRITVLDRPVLPPVLSCPAGAQVVAERRPLAFTVSAVDPQGQPITYIAQNLPRGATFDTVLRSFAWTPGFDQSGTYFPRFVAANGFVAAACTVQVVVNDRPVSPPRVTCPAPVVTAERRTTVFDVAAIDLEGDPITWLVRGLPANAVFAAGRVTWTPDITQAGIHDVEFVASDGEARDSCRVRLEVANHDAPLDPLEPVIAGVRDVPQDQGGWVTVRVVTAALDGGASPGVLGYTLWRRVGPGAAAPATGLSAFRQFPPGAWESVSFTPALQSLDLRLLAPTRADSGSGGPARDVFVVTAHSRLSADTWFASAPDSGTSVDNLAPQAPSLRVAPAAVAPLGVALAWTGSPDLDLAGYEVHRGDGADFVPGTGTLLAMTADTTLVDAEPVPGAWYRVVARDVHGNGSSSTAVASPGDAFVPRAFALAAPRPNPARGGVEFAFDLPVDRAVRLVVVDPRGRIVRVVADGMRAAGSHRVPWDGRDGRGRAVVAGIYLVRLEAGEGALTRKFVRL